MQISKQTPNQTIYEIIKNTERMTIGESVHLVNEQIKKINDSEMAVFGRIRTPQITDDDVRKARLWKR